MSRPTSIKIGFTRDLAIGVPFWTVVEYGARECAREHGLALGVRHCTSQIEMAAAIRTLTQQQVDAVVVAPMDPNDPAFLSALEAATEAGIPLVAVDMAIPHPVSSLVRSDDVQGIGAGAAYLVERLGGQGKVVHLQGELGSAVARLRSTGVHQVLDRHPDIQIVAETEQGGWRRDTSLSVMRAILVEHPDVRGVIAANDPMALGAVDALAEIGRQDQVIVVGVDGDADALLAIATGTLAATVRRSPYQMGRTAIETALTIIQGHTAPQEVLLDDMTLVTAETVTNSAIESLRIMPGVIDHLMRSSTDLTAERTMLRSIIDSLPDMIYVKDTNGRFQVVNQALAQLLGLPSPDAVIGKSDFDFFPYELAAHYQADEQSLIESGAVLRDKEELVFDSDGTQHWLVTTKVPLRDHKGRVVRLVGRGQDITDRKIAEAERQRLQEELIEAQQVALQELSTPLIPISDTVLVMPLIGRIDTRRAGQILETLLEGIQKQQADLAIIDITGVNVVDTQVAHALLQAARAVKLLGSQVVLTGLRSEVAQALVSLGVDLSDIVTRGTLQSGIAYGLGNDSR
jgi:PAS domain S-box-containing protein